MTTIGTTTVTTIDELKPMTATATGEPTIALPTGRLVLTVCAAATATASAWIAVTALLGRPADLAAGPAGAALVAGITIAGVLTMRPWKTRPIGDWMTLWLAALVGRLLLTPLLAYLLYSATQFGLVPLMLSVAVSYVIVQIGEASALAVYLKRFV